MTGPIAKTDLVLRPAGDGDADLLFALFRASREHEIAAWGLLPAQAEGFLRMQWQTERRARALQHPGAAHCVVVFEGHEVGRLLVEHRPDAILVVDIALLPGARGRGIGAALLEGVIAEATARGVPVTLSVRRGNPAERLYRRMGFEVTREGAMDREMSRARAGPER